VKDIGPAVAKVLGKAASRAMAADGVGRYLMANAKAAVTGQHADQVADLWLEMSEGERGEVSAHTAACNTSHTYETLSSSYNLHCVTT
jgi:hypothetical protein